MFITLDGGDGGGKSTQQKRLGDWFKLRGKETVLCRDPGSTALGDEIRKILLHGSQLNIGNRSEMFLFMAARAQMVDDVIKPALREGKIVISDRFLISNIVYQGVAGGLALDILEEVGRIAVEGILPDIEIILDCPYEAALKRVANRNVPDRIEQKGKDYHHRVRSGFLQYAALRPTRCFVIDASQSPNEIELMIRKLVESRFPNE